MSSEQKLEARRERPVLSSGALPATEGDFPTAPVVASVIVVGTGLLFSFFWYRLWYAGVFGRIWFEPGDISATLHTAQFVASGNYGRLYSATGQYLTTPGIAILFAPIAALSSAMHLGESYPYVQAHPTSWYLVGPVMLVLGCTGIFALDALARQLGVCSKRRRLLCVLQGFLVWQVTVFWGHPEDVVAVALAVYGIVAAMRGERTRAAWLLGAGIAFQPLVVLVLPLVIGRSGIRQALPTAARAIAPSMALLIVPFAYNFRETWKCVVEQPTFLGAARLTLWTRFAPLVAKDTVSCGPTRLVAVAGACVLGFVLVRSRGRYADTTLIWCAAVCLALRFVMESAEESYYIWPALALFVVAAARERKDRFQLTCGLSVALTLVSNNDFSRTWTWWAVCVLGLFFISLSSISPGVLREMLSGAPRNSQSADHRPYMESRRYSGDRRGSKPETQDAELVLVGSLPRNGPDASDNADATDA